MQTSTARTSGRCCSRSSSGTCDRSSTRAGSTPPCRPCTGWRCSAEGARGTSTCTRTPRRTWPRRCGGRGGVRAADGLGGGSAPGLHRRRGRGAGPDAHRRVTPLARLVPVSTREPIAVRADPPAVLDVPPAHLEVIWRPLQLRDATPLHGLLQAIETADSARERQSYEEVVELLTGPLVDLGSDSLGGFDDAGTIRAYALVEVRPGERVLRARP